MQKLNTKRILAEKEKEFADRVKKLEKHIDYQTSFPSGSFPEVGVRTGKLNKSLTVIKLNKQLHRLGIFVSYAKYALLKKGAKPRNLIERGSFYKFWVSLFK